MIKKKKSHRSKSKSPKKNKAKRKTARKVTPKKRTARKVTPKKRTARKSPAKRKKSKQLIVRSEQVTVRRVLSGKKKNRKKKRHVVMAGKRKRAVGKKGNSGLLIGLGIGALAFYMLSKTNKPQYPTYPQLPPLIPTQNYQRNDQANSVLNYALAAGLAVDAITKLVDRLNNSNDTQVKNIYDTVTTTGDVGVYV